jgi:hypothetical protein
VRLSTKLLGAACAIALGALIPASASADVAGTLSGSYANGSGGIAGASGSGDLWGIDGALAGTFNNNWGVEGDATYHDATGGGGNLWSFGGNLFWQGMDTRINANVTYHDLDGGLNFTNYGVGAEWFAGNSFTLAARGGALAGDNTSGGYVGGHATWYFTPDLNLNGGVDYTDLGHSANFTSEDIGLEWLFSHSFPVSVYGGYQHVDFPSAIGGSHGAGNIWFVGIRLYADGTRGDLVDRQRGGTLGYTGQSPFFLDKY